MFFLFDSFLMRLILNEKRIFDEFKIKVETLKNNTVKFKQMCNFQEANMQKILHEELLELTWCSLGKFRKVLFSQLKACPHTQQESKEKRTNLPHFQLQ